MRAAICACHSLRSLNPGSARVVFNGRHQYVVGQTEVDRYAHRLIDVPQRVDEDLKAVALGIARIKRNRIAVGDGHDFLHALRDKPLVKLLQRGNAARFKRDLVDRIERQVLGPAAR